MSAVETSPCERSSFWHHFLSSFLASQYGASPVMVTLAVIPAQEVTLRDKTIPSVIGELIESSEVIYYHAYVLYRVGI